MTERMTGTEVARAMTDALNVMGSEKEFAEAFVLEILKSHRTLQQAVGRVVVELIKKNAEEFDQGYCDLRNEAWLRLCSDIICAASNKDEAFASLRFPLI